MRPVLLVKKCRFLKTRVRVFLPVSFQRRWLGLALLAEPDIVRILKTFKVFNHPLRTKIYCSYKADWLQALVTETEEKSEVEKKIATCWKKVVKKWDLGNRWSTLFDWHEQAIKEKKTG